MRAFLRINWRGEARGAVTLDGVSEHFFPPQVSRFKWQKIDAYRASPEWQDIGAKRGTQRDQLVMETHSARAMHKTPHGIFRVRDRAYSVYA
jgi:hypothetical protein